MDGNPTNINQVRNNRLTLFYKKPVNLNQCRSENDTDKNDNINKAKEELNLFKGVEKNNRLTLKNANKTPLIKIKSLNDNDNNYKNIFEFTNVLYNNEEHLSKNPILTLKNFDKKSPRESLLSPIDNFHYNLSVNEKCEKNKSSMTLPFFSKEKNSNNIAKKSLFQKNFYHFSNFNFKRNTHKNITNRKYGQSNNNINRSIKKYSFFFKLKEKDKIPSKTPYLDKKFSFSTNKLNKFDANGNINNKTLNKNNNSNSHSVIKSKFQNNNIINKDNQMIKIELDKKTSLEKNKNNNIDINNNNKIEKSQKFNLGNTSKENKTIIPNKKERKNANIRIINILNNSLFCCLKS